MELDVSVHYLYKRINKAGSLYVAIGCLWGKGKASAEDASNSLSAKQLPYVIVCSTVGNKGYHALLTARRLLDSLCSLLEAGWNRQRHEECV